MLAHKHICLNAGGNLVPNRNTPHVDAAVTESDQDETDISGAWTGLYQYTMWPAISATFGAALLQSGQNLTGRTTEQPGFGRAKGLIMEATLDGLRTGASVSWTKTYDDRRLFPEPVRYVGVLNHDASEISGTWTIRTTGWLIKRGGAGTFLMVRDRGKEAAQTQEKRVAEPVA